MVDDPWSVLGLARGADAAAIRAAWRRAAARHHPDRRGDDPEAAEALARARAAFEHLIAEAQRDEGLRGQPWWTDAPADGGGLRWGAGASGARPVEPSPRRCPVDWWVLRGGGEVAGVPSSIPPGTPPGPFRSGAADPLWILEPRVAAPARRDGDDVWWPVEVRLRDVVLGASPRVWTPVGALALPLAAGRTPRPRRIEGLGIPRRDGTAGALVLDPRIGAPEVDADAPGIRDALDVLDPDG